MMKIAVYGIPNCDTVKKARKYLDARGLDYVFHDFKKEGAEPERLARWVGAKGVDTVLNRRGTTYRKLDEADKADIDAGKAVTLLQSHPSMIKRPIVEYGVEHANGLLIGFKEDEWDAAL